MNIIAQDTLIHSGDIWQYLDDGSDPGRTWTELSFSTEDWKEGPSPLGYGYDDLATIISYGDTTAGEKLAEKYITSYFKKTIHIEDVSSYLAYKINYKRDDGAIIYVNNIEVVRSNMPYGVIDYKTESKEIIKGREEHLILTKYLESEALFQGTNSISIEIHQRMRTSTDIIMAFELIAIDNEKDLRQFLANDSGKINNDNLELLDMKHQLNEELIRSDFNSKIIRIQMWIIGIGVLFFGILCFLFYRRYLQQLKERELQSAEKKKLEDLLKHKNQESINFSIASIRNKNFFKEIKLELLQVSTAHSNIKNDLSKLINRIDVQSQNEEDWEQMKLHLDSIYSGFFERLSHQYPVLSQQELKHCGFIKLRLDTKEISQILRIGPKSVQAARYRIKKKMKLSDTDDLRTVICDF